MFGSTNTIVDPITVFTRFRINRNVLIVRLFNIIHIRDVAVFRHTNFLLPSVRIFHTPNIDSNLPAHMISDFYCVIKSFNERRNFTNTFNSHII